MRRGDFIASGVRDLKLHVASVMVELALVAQSK